MVMICDDGVGYETTRDMDTLKCIHTVRGSDDLVVHDTVH